MLDNYSDSQKGVCNLFRNQINNNQISHAYLIDDNNSGVSYDISIAFVKEIMLSENSDCSNLFTLIDSGNYPELKIIKPDGMFIKKSQLNQLQDDFSKSSIYGKRKIYIIQDADKMRPDAANAILKFLEEPISNITAILITNNFNNMLSTIISRCQVVRLNSISSLLDIKDFCLNFVKSVESNKFNSFLNEKNLIFDYIDYKNKDELIYFIDSLINIYYDILNVVIGREEIISENNISIINEIANNNDLENIINKINFLIDAKDSVKYNVNANLLIDSIIFNIGGCCEYCWN